MSRLELTKEFAKHLVTGDHLSQDEHGFYVRYDIIEVCVDTGTVTFKRGQTAILSIQLSLGPGITLNITDLDGRLRLAMT
jgi:hypothetical protein